MWYFDWAYYINETVKNNTFIVIHRGHFQSIKSHLENLNQTYFSQSQIVILLWLSGLEGNNVDKDGSSHCLILVFVGVGNGKHGDWEYNIGLLMADSLAHMVGSAATKLTIFVMHVMLSIPSGSGIYIQILIILESFL